MAYIVRFIPKHSWQNLVWLCMHENDYYSLQNDKNHATRFDEYAEADDVARQAYEDRLMYDYKGYEIQEQIDHDEQRVQEAINWLMGQPAGYRYRMLDRMRQDCEYYLGNGRRHPQYLWMTMDEQGHIDVMRALWDSFAPDEKPEWLSMAQINRYAREMGVN